MASRFASLLIALTLVVATGTRRSVSFLCLMDGQVRSACCCKSVDAKSADRPTVERDTQCCEVQFSKATQARATTRDGLQDHRLPMPLGPTMVPPAIEIPHLTTASVVPALGARAPPGGIGPPIFVRNCSYLI